MKMRILIAALTVCFVDCCLSQSIDPRLNVSKDIEVIRKTIAIARSKDLPVPQYSFLDSLTVHVGKEVVVCRYFGAAHTVDNIVSWIPAERILFGGCMVRDLTSETLGNTQDADLAAWPSTIARVLAAYPAVHVVIPGHGAFGGSELLRHTQVLLKKTK